MNEYDPGPHPSDMAPRRPRQPKKKGMPGWVIALIAVGAVVVIGCGGCFGVLVYIGASSPDTYVYSGNQVPSSYIDTAQKLGLIDDDENVLFFYSDAVLDVEDAMYILTDKHLVLHNAEWTDPQKVIPFSEIAAVSAEWSDEWIMDSMITVELTDGSTWLFPLSMENDTDHRFVEKLCESAGVPTP